MKRVFLEKVGEICEFYTKFQSSSKVLKKFGISEQLAQEISTIYSSIYQCFQVTLHNWKDNYFPREWFSNEVLITHCYVPFEQRHQYL